MIGVSVGQGSDMKTADQSSDPKTESTETRRKALVRFGRYAALAPTTMILLGPREGDAAPKKRGRNKPKKPKGRKGPKQHHDDYFDD